MNIEKDTERFRFNAQDEPNDDLIRSEIEDLSIEKLNHRMTLISILIPCLVIVVLIISYIDIKRRVITTQTTGSEGVQSLSKDLESRFSSLSVKQAKLEDQFIAISQAFEKNSAITSVQYQKLETALNNLKNVSTDKNTLEQSISRLDASISQVRAETSNFTTGLKPQFDKLDQQLSMLTEDLNEIKRDMNELSDKTDGISQIVAEKIDKKQLDLSMKLSELRAQEGIVTKTKIIEQQISSIQNELKALKAKVNTLPPSGSSSRLPPATTPAAIRSTQADETPSSTEVAPGTIIEQNLN